MSVKKILETERLILREIVETDAEFILDLLNQPSFLKYIGDRNVRTVEEAKNFIETRYRVSYAQHGFGLYTVELKSEIPDSKFQIPDLEIRNPKSKSPNPSIGMCGFVKRDTLPDADIGFAFLPQFEKKGYAFEAASAVMKYGKEVLGLKRVLAITTQDNESSGKLLDKLGFKYDGLIESDNETLKLFSINI
ncbi:MAG: GNAT family N-acetyltransferase [Pyrinomonadaceae bacterium]|nr:GNAT family N-acetyltransferase [Pyrinomonadaceae bacterium]